VCRRNGKIAVGCRGEDGRSHTNKEIGSLLGITVKTVETYKTNAMQKLEITCRADLVRFALAQGWLER
jgi:DNA-binding NarL/FixJ family response regulator